jgi:hypothetical protein
VTALPGDWRPNFAALRERLVSPPPKDRSPNEAGEDEHHAARRPGVATALDSLARLRPADPVLPAAPTSQGAEQPPGETSSVAAEQLRRSPHNPSGVNASPVSHARRRKFLRCQEPGCDSPAMERLALAANGVDFVEIVLCRAHAERGRAASSEREETWQ